MKHKITSVTELGALVRATRKSVAMRMDDLAATSNLSKQFVNDVELGVGDTVKSTVFHPYLMVRGESVSSKKKTRSPMKKAGFESW